MLAREHLSVALVAALVACARARPDAPLLAKRSYSAPDVNLTPVKGGTKTGNVKSVEKLELPTTHAVIRADDHVIHFKDPLPSLSPPPPLPYPDNSNEEAKLAPVTSNAEVEEKAIPQVFREESKPVNKRYPHAVLFGGTCGGTIIHPKWVLTAGHCTLFTGGRYVLAGTNNSDDGSGVTKKVKKLYVHPLFSVGPYWLNAKNFNIKQVAARFDFMLAELEEPFDLNGETIAAVPLDESVDHQPGTYVGYAGYGTDHHGGFMRSEMHAMHLKTRPDEECATLQQFNSKDMLCAKGYEPHFDSACNGDSGSGLVDGKKLLGVTSWVQNDAYECRNGNLVVFSKVSSARDWIKTVSGV